MIFAIILVGLLGFIFGGFLFRRKPTITTSIVPCPYCGKPAIARGTAAGPEIECKDCGTFSNADVEGETVP